MAALPQKPFSVSSRLASGSAGWFYEVGGETRGPFSFAQMREFANANTLQADHLVWKNEDAKKEAQQIVGLIPKSKRIEPSKAAGARAEKASQKPASDPYAPPARSIADGPPGGMYLPHLRSAPFPYLLAALIAVIGLLILAAALPDERAAIFMRTLAGFSLVYAIVLALVWLHRAWDMMAMFGGTLSGAKAVRYFCIPVFNALWGFIALHEWARLWNRNVRDHPGLRPAQSVWRPAFFLFPILFLFSQALLIMHASTGEWPRNLGSRSDLISLGIWCATLLNGLICWWQISVSINFLARKKS